MTIHKVIKEILANELDIPLNELEAEEQISMQALPEWDSLTHTQIILAIERRFAQSVNTVAASQANDLATLVALVEV